MGWRQQANTNTQGVQLKNQQRHHKKESFKEEMHRLFVDNGIKDDSWFWVDN